MAFRRRPFREEPAEADGAGGTGAPVPKPSQLALEAVQAQWRRKETDRWPSRASECGRIVANSWAETTARESLTPGQPGATFREADAQDLPFGDNELSFRTWARAMFPRLPHHRRRRSADAFGRQDWHDSAGAADPEEPIAGRDGRADRGRDQNRHPQRFASRSRDVPPPQRRLWPSGQLPSCGSRRFNPIVGLWPVFRTGQRRAGRGAAAVPTRCYG